MAPSTIEVLAAAPWIGPEGYDPDWDDLDSGLLGYYNREGDPISRRTYYRLRLANVVERYVRVERTNVGPYFVSTVWLGLDHSFGYGPPVIFETMVFNDETGEADLDSARYRTEDEAVAGHVEMVEKVRLIVEASS